MRCKYFKGKMNGVKPDTQRCRVRLREIREARALSQRGLSSISGVAQDTISDIERGLRKPHGGTIRKLAKALDVEVEDITGGVPAIPLAETSPPLAELLEERRKRFHDWKTAILDEGLAWEREIEAVANGEQALPGPRWASTLQLAAIGLLDWLEDQGVHEELGPVLDAIDAGKPIPEDLRREAISLWNAMVALLDVGNKAYAAARKARGGSPVEESPVGKRAVRQRRRKTEDVYDRPAEAVA